MSLKNMKEVPNYKSQNDLSLTLKSMKRVNIMKQKSIEGLDYLKDCNYNRNAK